MSSAAERTTCTEASAARSAFRHRLLRARALRGVRRLRCVRLFARLHSPVPIGTISPELPAWALRLPERLPPLQGV